MLGSPILYLKGMRILMFQLSSIYYKALGVQGLGFLGGVGFRSVATIRVATGFYASYSGCVLVPLVLFFRSYCVHFLLLCLSCTIPD